MEKKANKGRALEAGLLIRWIRKTERKGLERWRFLGDGWKSSVYHTYLLGVAAEKEGGWGKHRGSIGEASGKHMGIIEE